MRTFALCSLLVLAGTALRAAEDAEQKIVVTTRPRIEQRKHYTYLVLANTNQSFDIPWGMPSGTRYLPLIPLSLDTNQVYAFTVIPPTNPSNTWPVLCKVQSGGQTIYDSEICEVHKTTMERKEVPIHYGMIRPAPNEPSLDSEHRLFPNRRESSLGGCVITPISPKTKRLYVCMDCKKAYEKWKSDNQKTK